MRKMERQVKQLKIVQCIISEDQYRRLRIRAAMDSCSVSDLIRIRLADIIDPEADFVGVVAPR